MNGDKVVFHVGAFGIAGKVIDGVVKILCNVRTDQEKQRKLANLPEDSTVLLVDCTGGAIAHRDASLQAGMTREVCEETGVLVQLIDGEDFRQPLELMGDRMPPYDLAFWRPIRIVGQPKASPEARYQVWLSRKELEDANVYRAVSGLGLAGRTGRMMVAALDYYETCGVNNSGIFS